jgi:hypothetical protein
MQGFLFSKAVPVADFEARFLVVREVEPAGVASR